MTIVLARPRCIALWAAPAAAAVVSSPLVYIVEREYLCHAGMTGNRRKSARRAAARLLVRQKYCRSACKNYKPGVPLVQPPAGSENQVRPPRTACHTPVRSKHFHAVGADKNLKTYTIKFYSECAGIVSLQRRADAYLEVAQHHPRVLGTELASTKLGIQ